MRLANGFHPTTLTLHSPTHPCQNHARQTALPNNLHHSRRSPLLPRPIPHQWCRRPRRLRRRTRGAINRCTRRHNRAAFKSVNSSAPASRRRQPTGASAPLAFCPILRASSCPSSLRASSPVTAQNPLPASTPQNQRDKKRRTTPPMQKSRVPQRNHIALLR